MPEAVKKRYYIDVHPEMIEILEKLRKNIKETTWDILDKEISWKELTGILARKIRQKLAILGI